MNKGMLIQPVIDKGIELLGRGDNLSQDMLSIWIDYSQSMMRLVSNTSQGQLIYLRYQNLLISQINNTFMTPYNKLSQCVNYLISIQWQL